MLEASSLAWTHLQPNDFMQNLATVHRADIRGRGGIWAPAGRGRTSFVDVRDVAEAPARTLTEPGHGRRACTLTGGEAFGLEEVAVLLSEALNRPVAYRKPGRPRLTCATAARGAFRARPSDGGSLYQTP